jgi:hypothetical protein
MRNGNSVLDESTSVLYAYDAPEIERSKVLLEKLCRIFDGKDMQVKYNQMLLFEKLIDGTNVEVSLEQEKLFQEQGLLSSLIG